MRKYRNLVSITITLGFFALVMLISPVLSISAMGRTQHSSVSLCTTKEAPCALSPVPVSLGTIKPKMELTSFRTPMLTTQSLMPLKSFSDAVSKWEAAYLSAQQAELAARTRAASASTPTTTANASTSLVGTTTASTATFALNDGSGWYQVAICEEGLHNDPRYGYFGIESENWPAGESPETMDYEAQEAYANQLNGGHAPWCPPTCAAGGYRGW